MRCSQVASHRLIAVLVVLTGLSGSWALAQAVKTAAELGLSGLSPETEVLVLQSDPTATAVEPIRDAGPGNGELSSSRGMG